MVARFSDRILLVASQGKLISTSQPFEAARVWTDTRTLTAGDFFVPLSGERFDGHDYLPQAFKTGAIGAFVQQDKAKAHPEWQQYPNLIAVADPLAAYLAVAKHYRKQVNPKVIAVTGSSGKTTTKEMLAAAIGPLKRTVKTQKNFNNEIGVAQTLLSLQPDTEVLIVEMGMRGLRQICILSEAACPDVSMVMNIGPAHIGLLGSLENIAKAKLEIAEGLSPESGVLVLNADAPYLTDLAPTLWKGKTVSYQMAEVQEIAPIPPEAGGGVRFIYKGIEVTLSVPGEHMVANALGVLKVGEVLGLPIEDLARGLTQFVPEEGRWQKKELAGYHNVCVVDDSYNANPDSAKASLKALLSSPQAGQRCVVVLGGMKELGEFSEAYHRELGLWLAGQPQVAALFTLGEEGVWIADAASSATYPIRHAQSLEHLVKQLIEGPVSLENTLLYLKGSRAYRLNELPERLVEAKNRLLVGESHV